MSVNTGQDHTFASPSLFATGHKFILSCDNTQYPIKKFYYGNKCTAAGNLTGSDVDQGCIDITEKYAPYCNAIPCNITFPVPLDTSFITSSQKNVYVAYQCPSQSNLKTFFGPGPATMNLNCSASIPKSTITNVIYGDKCPLKNKLGYPNGVNVTSLFTGDPSASNEKDRAPLCPSLSCSFNVPDISDICYGWDKNLDITYPCPSHKKPSDAPCNPSQKCLLECLDPCDPDNFEDSVFNKYISEGNTEKAIEYQEQAVATCQEQQEEKN